MATANKKKLLRLEIPYLEDTQIITDNCPPTPMQEHSKPFKLVRQDAFVGVQKTEDIIKPVPEASGAVPAAKKNERGCK